MQYIEEKIGSKYKNWVNGNVILISAQTGTGKTSFILRTLLPFAKENGKHILYFVNRRILKEQLEEELLYCPVREKTYIQLETYQHIERKLSCMQSENKYMKFCEKYQKYDYIVCDEAHYFSSDSNFNTYTNLSYNWIRWMFSKKIRIFISATLDLVEQKICNDVKDEGYFHDCCYDLAWRGRHSDNVVFLPNYKIIKYKSKRDYSYFACTEVVNPKELPALVKTKKGKWLVFVDDIRFGKELENDIKDKLKGTNDDYDSNVLFLTAEYNKVQETYNAVDEIAQKKCQSAKVLICTAVMENGVTIKDRNVKNIAIGIDVEDQFIQMLGRKRVDGDEQVNLYLLKKSKSHIMNRLYEVRQAKKLSDKCGIEIHRIQDIINILNSNDELSMLDNKDPDLQWIFDEFWNGIKCEWNDIAWNSFLSKIYNSLYWKLDIIAKRNFMEHNEASWKIFYLYYSCFYANLFSMRRIEYLCQYYNNLIQEFDMFGDNALVRRQLMWMGKNEEQVNQSIEEIGDSLFQASRNKIITKFEEIADRKMTGDGWKGIINGLKKEFNDLFDFSDIADSKEWEDVKKSVLKTDRTLSIDKMETIKEPFNLPFTLKKERDKNTNKDIFYLVKDE